MKLDFSNIYLYNNRDSLSIQGVTMKKELKILIKKNANALKNSKRDFKSIYEITFSNASYVMAEGNDGFRTYKYSYGDIFKRCESAANAIYAKIGDTHGWVGLQMENGVDWIAAFWGILKSGNKPYLVNTRHPDSITKRIFETLNIDKVICDKKGTLDLDYIEFSSLPESDICDAEFENEIAIATSATSLNETICIYDGRSISAQILNSEKIVKDNRRITKHYKGQLKILAFLPFYHIFGLCAVYFWFTFFGRTLVFLNDMAPETILNTCRRHEVTHIFAVPLLWHTIEKKVLNNATQQGKLEKLNKGIRLCTKLQNAFPYFGTKISKKIMSDVTDQIFGQSVQFLISGGSFIRKSTLELFNGIGYALHNGYGMSEIGIASVEFRDRPADRNLASIGLPFESAEYKVDEDGVLYIKGESVCIRRIKGDQEIVTDGWFKTGDIVNCDEKGYYYVVGRQSDVVIGENSENINPDTVENFFNVKDVIALSVLGLSVDSHEELCLVAQISKYLSSERIIALKHELEKINSMLPLTMQVRKFYMTYDALSAETAIKVSRKYLQRAIDNGAVNLLPFNKTEVANDIADENPIAKKVAEIIADVLSLNLEDIDYDAHIMIDLGATSLQYFSILSALANEFSVSAQDGENYAYTVRDISAYIERYI